MTSSISRFGKRGTSMIKHLKLNKYNNYSRGIKGISFI